MDAYLNALLAPELPLPWGLALGLWLVLYGLTHLVTSRARATVRAQSHLVIERADEIDRIQRPSGMILAFVVLTAFLLIGYPMGEPYTSLVTGGLLGMIAMTLGLGLHSLWFAQSVARGDGVRGELRLTPRFVLTNIAHGALGGAAAFFAAGILFAQIALFGAALLLLVMGVSHIERARKLPA